MPNALTASIALSIACAALSVFVVSRRWAFIGEGISHSGFGGAGTAWMLTLLFPGLAFPALPQFCVILFCTLTGLAIGFLSNRRRTNADAAIGIFMVASLAWGFLAAELYRSVKHQEPAGLGDFLFGQMSNMNSSYALSVILLSCAVIVVLIAFGKEILYCSFDAEMARASGVPADLIHYVLMLLVTLTIVLGIRIAGSVLVTALLVLPGATAVLLSQRLRTVFVIAITTAAIGTAAGVMIHLWKHAVPAGPVIVLAMFAEFVACYLISRATRRVVVSLCAIAITSAMFGAAGCNGAPPPRVAIAPRQHPLFFEDFESGQLDPILWTRQITGSNTIEVQKEKTAHGKYALRVSCPVPSTKTWAFISMNTLPVQLRQHHFGRAYVYITPQPPARHTILIMAGTPGFPENRYQEIATANGRWQMTWVELHPTGDREDYHAAGSIPVDRWVCLEWEFNDNPNHTTFWVDGNQILDTGFRSRKTGATQNLVGGFTDYAFGLRLWGDAPAPFDVYYDDIALDTNRIGGGRRRSMNASTRNPS